MNLQTASLKGTICANILIDYLWIINLFINLLKEAFFEVTSAAV